MNVRLLYLDKESELTNANINKSEILQDFNLDIILKFMARNDEYIYRTARTVMTSPVADKDLIMYRQEIIADCVKNHDSILEIYELTSSIIDENERYKEGSKKMNSSNLSDYAAAQNTLEQLSILVKGYEKIKSYLDSVHISFESRGLISFYDQLCEEYNDEFVKAVKDSINNLNFLSEGGEITISSTIGNGLKIKDIVINHLGVDVLKKKKIAGKVSLLINRFVHKKVIMLENTKLYEDARELESAGMAHVAKLFTGFIQELTAFFESLHFQVAFYVGAANLKKLMAQLRLPQCWPKVSENGKDFKFNGLYDLSLGIYKRETPVCNDLNTDNMKLLIITGANQGGKSTYLRSIGIAQLMLQSGMFVPASSYCSKAFDGLFSHFTRREDTALNSGKLDEELSRMSRILTQITPDSLLLMNESFASTTEKEGTKIALDVVNALYENETKIIMVTHLFEFTKTMLERKLEQSMFLSAERLDDGTRTFKILEKEPERTSYGLDLYDKILNCDL
jgi:DNA mismatch repair ATPase MutS